MSSFEISIAELKRYKLPGCNKIPVQFFKPRAEILLSVIPKFINSVWNME
jgi:hypothetical protein